MSEVVPLPSFGEVFFDARGQERCLRVTWHEGTLVLSLWRGEMCTASFRMPMEDVGRLLDTLDEGFAEATGEQPAVPAHDPGTEAIPGTEVIPGTGQYQRPPQPTAPQHHHQQQPAHHQLDERPTAALSPNDVLVARGPAPQDKLVASFGESAAPRDTTPAYGEPAVPFTGPQYVESTAPQPQYTGDPFSGPQYTGDPFSGPQYTGDPFSGPQYTPEPPPYQQQPDRFGGSQYADNQPVYQMPEEQRRLSPLSTDPLGFPSQAADPYAAAPQHRPEQYPSDPYPADPYASDSFGRRQEAYQQPQPQLQPQGQSAAGLGTPMHGIPGAGRRRAPQPTHDDYAAYQQAPQANPVDPLLALGRQEPQQPDAGMSRPYVGDPMFSTGERLRPEQQHPDYHQRSDRREW
ncbi:hypothetical protein ETD86_45665 [Nonomuraea turkmeniaca]|uniref:Uncharacterized protein n=1 Tax=Nonomuraea turkmeniaca TaxID=103838 RepID=A0A5S4EYX1_9ACTN|nr:hypothetical protein [Nonomuraea turkmeniaca]TMR08933.1 hypothetical protein ETD86_45665 [Nonomuraea turkmeniaca]